jgi:hypothetical protein
MAENRGDTGTRGRTKKGGEVINGARPPRRPPAEAEIDAATDSDIHRSAPVRPQARTALQWVPMHAVPPFKLSCVSSNPLGRVTVCTVLRRTSPAHPHGALAQRLPRVIAS